MIKELNFKNLTVRYDGEKLSKSTIKKVKIIEGIGIFIFLFVLFGVTGLNTALWDLEHHFGLSILIGFVSIGTVMFGGVFGFSKICEKFSPRHYEFITWLMKFKSNEIEIGWLNDRYVVNMYGQHGWMKKEFCHFIDEDYKIEDRADKSKPVHMIIDLTRENIGVVVENR